MATYSACHRCPFGVVKMNEDGDLVRSGSYEGVEWKDLPCKTCTLPEGLNTTEDPTAGNHFRSKVSLDALNIGTGDDFNDCEYTGWNKEREGWEEMNGIESLGVKAVVAIFADLFRFFIRMDAKTQRIVCYWFVDQPLSVAGKELNMTPQGVHRRLKSAHEKYPILKQVKSIIR